MGSLNEAVKEMKQLLEEDVALRTVYEFNYNKQQTIMLGDVPLSDVPIRNTPVIIISDSYDEKKTRRFLFDETEAFLKITFGILENDQEKALNMRIEIKEAIKNVFKNNRTLNSKAAYCTVTKSRKLDLCLFPLHFVELTVYVNMGRE